MLDKIIIIFSSNTFTAIANAIAIISLFITISVFLDVRKIKRFYIFSGRVPKLVRDLKKHSSTISECLNDFDNFPHQIEEELIKTEVALKSLKKKTSGETRNSISGILKEIGSYETQYSTSDDLRNIYNGIIKVNAEIANQKEDRKWEIPS